MKDTLAYWDGERWTGQVQPAKQAGVPKRQQPAVIVGTLVAVAIVVLVILGVAGSLNRSDCEQDQIRQGRSMQDC